VFDFQDAAKADGAMFTLARLNAKGQKLKVYSAFSLWPSAFAVRCFGSVTVAELDEIVFAVLDPATPVRGVTPKFLLLRLGNDLREVFPLKIEV